MFLSVWVDIWTLSTINYVEQVSYVLKIYQLETWEDCFSQVIFSYRILKLVDLKKVFDKTLYYFIFSFQNFMIYVLKSWKFIHFTFYCMNQSYSSIPNFHAHTPNYFQKNNHPIWQYCLIKYLLHAFIVFKFSSRKIKELCFKIKELHFVYYCHDFKKGRIFIKSIQLLIKFILHFHLIFPNRSAKVSFRMLHFYDNIKRKKILLPINFWAVSIF